MICLKPRDKRWYSEWGAEKRKVEGGFGEGREDEARTR